MELEIEIGRQAKQEIDGALAEDPFDNAALVVHAGEAEQCCGVGFEVVLVEKRDVPSKGYVMVGERNGWPIYIAEEITPSKPSRLVINVDRTNDRLAALFLSSDP